MSSGTRFQAPVGTQDVLPPASARWQQVIARFAARVGRAGYGLIINPMFEDAGVFLRGIGEVSEVVTKEMYDFRDKGDRHLALRPEGTASVVRAYLQHRPPVPFKAWYVTPAFRYERPQAGRYRQHHQMGIEALGSEDPELDVEVVSLAAGLYSELGLRQIALNINSMGDANCRPAYVAALLDFLRPRRDELCDEHREKLEINPVRVLDCKRQACRAATESAPVIRAYLCPDCTEHYEQVLSGLDALGVSYAENPRLVRGLDYYTRTTFEFAAEALSGAQNGAGGGGRYDGLAESLGGPPTPGIGFGLGIERILLACDAEAAGPPEEVPLDAYLIDVVGGRQATVLADRLRRSGLRVDRGFDRRSMKAQMKAADRSGAAVAVIVGEEEAAEEAATVRPLRGGGEQERVAISDLADAIRRLSEASTA